MSRRRKSQRPQPPPVLNCLHVEPMESAMGGAGDISGGMGGSAGGDIGEMAEAGLLKGVDPRSAIGLPTPISPAGKPHPPDSRSEERSPKLPWP